VEGRDIAAVRHPRGPGPLLERRELGRAQLPLGPLARRGRLALLALALGDGPFPRLWRDDGAPGAVQRFVFADRDALIAHVGRRWRSP
jgi:hypothetical protein